MHFTKIVLPTRPQPDTIVAIYILKTYGATVFPGVGSCAYALMSTLEDGRTERDYLREGTILIDIGGGIFDHHNKPEKTTASALVATALGVSEDKSLAKLLAYAERDDFYGKGTQSNDPLDRAFGLSGLIAALNKTYADDMRFVIESVLPLLKAHHELEKQRCYELPKEVEELKSAGKFSEIEVLQKKNDLKVCFLESDNVQLPGYFRATDGGRYDVVVQRRSSGHVNIITRPLKRPDLRKVAELVRGKEYELRHGSPHPDVASLSMPARNDQVPMWYFDPATNSLQNGGINHAGVEATVIPWDTIKDIVEEGLSMAQ